MFSYLQLIMQQVEVVEILVIMAEGSRELAALVVLAKMSPEAVVEIEQVIEKNQVLGEKKLVVEELAVVLIECIVDVGYTQGQHNGGGRGGRGDYDDGT